MNHCRHPLVSAHMRIEAYSCRMLAILCITSLLASRVLNPCNLTFYTIMEWITGPTEGKIVFFKLSVSRRNHTSLK